MALKAERRSLRTALWERNFFRISDISVAIETGVVKAGEIQAVTLPTVTSWLHSQDSVKSKETHSE